MCKDKSPAAARFGAGRLRVCVSAGRVRAGASAVYLPG